MKLQQSIKKTGFAAALLALALLASFSTALKVGNDYTATGIFVGNASSSSEKLSYSFVARETANVMEVGLLTRKFGLESVLYNVTLNVDLNGVPGGELAQGLFTSTLPGRSWKFVVLNQAQTLDAGSRYHLVLQLYNKSFESAENYVTNAFLGGRGQPDERWPLDLIGGGLKTLHYNGTAWKETRQTPSFILKYSNELGSGNPYNSVTSAKIYDNYWVAQRFVISARTRLENVSVFVRKSASANPKDALYFHLRYANNTPITAQAQLVANNNVAIDYAWLTAPLPTGQWLSPDTYLLVVHSNSSNSTSFYRWLALATADFYNKPNVNATFNGTQSGAQSSSNRGGDWIFRRDIDHAFYFNATQDVTPPRVKLVEPINGTTSTAINSTFNFTCQAWDNLKLAKVELFANFTGSWAANATNSTPINNSETNFKQTLPEGHYVWNCRATDGSGNAAFAEFNHTLTIVRDLTPPSVTALEVKYPRGQDFVRPGENVTLELNVTDSSGVEKVTVNASLIGGQQTENMALISGSLAANKQARLKAVITAASSVDEGDYKLQVNARDLAKPVANVNNTEFFEVEVRRAAPVPPSSSVWDWIKGLFGWR